MTIHMQEGLRAAGTKTRLRPVVYLGLIDADESIKAKIQEKHNITLAEVKEAVQWPARAQVAFEDHPEHGERWIAVGETAEHREVVAWLLPVPEYAEGAADTWRVKTARWVDEDD